MEKHDIEFGKNVTEQNDTAADSKANGQKYFIDIEGTEYPWYEPIISVEQIAALGGWTTEGVIEIDKDNVEHTLIAGQVIELKPGHGFAKKVRWKRGDSLFEDRLSEELAYLQGRFDAAVRQGMWFKIPNYPLPQGWNRTDTDVAFRIQPGYPSTAPYGFYVLSGLRFDERIPGNYQDLAGDPPPFGGQWGMFSWAPVEWRPADDIARGFNLLNFALSFTVRLKEGA